jgi:hypothetical protein
LNPNTGLTTDSEPIQNTVLTTDSEPIQNTGLTTDSEPIQNTGLTTDSEPNQNTRLTTGSNMQFNTGLLADSDFILNTGLPTDSDVRLNTQLSADSDLKLNTDLPTGRDIRLNSALSVDCDMNVNTGLLRESDLKKLNSQLSTDNKLNTRNAGSSPDSFSAIAVGGTVKDVQMKFQMRPLLADIEKESGNVLAVTESCAKYAESSASSKGTAGKYEVVPTSNQSREFSVTSLCNVSDHICSTAVGSPFPATVTAQAVDILQDSVGLETVATAAYNDPGTGDGEMIVSVQSVTKDKVEINTCDKMVFDSSSVEKLFGVLSAEISHSVTNSDNISTANRTGVISAEDGTPKVTLYTVIDRGEQSCTNIRGVNDVASSPEFLGVGEILCSFSAVDKVREKVGSDGVGEVDTRSSIACTVRESPDDSCFRVREENVNAVTKHSFVSENSVPVMVDVENTIQPLSVPDTDSLTFDVLSLALGDVHVAANVTYSLCDETVMRGLHLETDSSTAESMFPKMNSIVKTRQQNLMTHGSTGATVTDSGQAVASGVPIILDNLMSEGKSHTLQTNCVPSAVAETAYLKSDNTSIQRYPDTAVLDIDILERLPVTTKARHRVTSRSYNTRMSCPQSPVVGSGLQQKEIGNRTPIEKPELCFQSRAGRVGINLNSMLDLNGHQYSRSAYGGCPANYPTPSVAEVKNRLVAGSQNSVTPQTVRMGDSRNSRVVTCRESVPLPDLSKLGEKVVSVMYVNPHVSPTDLPHQQNLNSVQPLFSESSGAVSQKGAKHHKTAPKTEQNDGSGKCSSSGTLLSKPNGVKLCNSQQSKLNTKEVNINIMTSYLKSHTTFSYSNKEKFSGFSFEKPLVPKTNLRSCSKKKKISKTERLPKVRKTQSEQNELFLTLTNNPHPDSSKCNSSSTDFSNGITMLANHGSVEDHTVENTNVADRVFVKNKSDNDSLDWLQQLLM